MLNECNIEITNHSDIANISMAFHTAMVLMSFGGKVNFVFYCSSEYKKQESALLMKYNEELNNLKSFGQHALFVINSHQNWPQDTKQVLPPEHGTKLSYAQWSEHKSFLNSTFNF